MTKIDDNSSVKTKNELMVAFHNNLNKEVIRNLTENESNLLMGIIGKLKERNHEEIIITFEEIIEVSGLERNGPKKIKEFVEDFWEKVKVTDYTTQVKTEFMNKTGMVMLFSALEIDETRQEIMVAINPHLDYFVNDFHKGSFTALALGDFKRVKTRYSKILYRLLAQFETTGLYRVDLERLRELLDVPEKYTTKHFHYYILDPAIKELSLKFEDLEVEKKKRGRRVIGYEFTFKPVVRKKAEVINVVDPTVKRKPGELTEDEMVKVLKMNY